MRAGIAETTMEVVESLGKLTAKQLAGHLASRNIKGTKGTPKSCPLAQYFRSRGYTDISVGSTSVTLGTHKRWGRYFLPQSVHDFVNQFDRGRFPELVEQET